MDQEMWPSLPYEQWKETCQTLNRWVQVVGKIRLSKSPWTNHGWHSTLYLTERGLTTSVIHDESVSFAIEFDFVSHLLRIRTSQDDLFSFALHQKSVSSFYDRCLSDLRRAGIEAHIFAKPNELADDMPFAGDEIHHAYDSEYVNRFWQVLLQTDRLMKLFRSKYLGKVSPVHFFWGAMDLAVTRFSGRRAPEHPGGVPHLPDRVTQEAYSHELSSCGFWPGNETFPAAAFYSYAYPKPDGFERARVPQGAYFDEKLREFILPYELVRGSSDPDKLVLDFFQQTYEAAADLGKWDREALEHSRYLEMLQRKAA